MRRLFLLVALCVAPAVAQQPVQLQWTASTTAGTTVRVYRGSVCGGSFAVIAQNVPAGGPFQTIIPSTPGSSVAFQVTAVVNGVESIPSNCAIISIPGPPAPPQAPTSLIVSPIS